MSDIDILMSLFEDDDRALAREYSIINGILAKEGLRSAGAEANFSSTAIEQHVLRRSMQLAEGMSLDGKEILSLCYENVLVFSKLILSFYRRAHSLYVFHAEGRVRATAGEEGVRISVIAGEADPDEAVEIFNA